MYCPKCGKALPDGTRFCAFCGAPTEDDIPQDIQSGQTQTASTRAYSVYQAPGASMNQAAGAQTRPALSQTNAAQANRMRAGRILALIGGAMLLLAVFLPAYSAGGINYYYLRGYNMGSTLLNRIANSQSQSELLVVGIIQLGLGAAVLLLAYFRKKPALLALTAISVYLTFIPLFEFGSMKYVTCGAGPTLAFFGAVMAFVGSFLIKRD